jgi:hypothetical protein
MNSPARDNLQPIRESGGGTIRRRHILYVGGYDRLGTKGYFDLFRRTCDRFQQLWPVSLTLQPLEIDSADLAHWLVDMRGANWQTATHYDFLRLESFVRSDMARPTAWQVLGALGWIAGELVSGTQFRIFRASWRFGLSHLYFQLLLLAWLAVAAMIALTVARTVTEYLGWSVAVGIIVSLLAALVTLFALRPIAERWRAIQISSGWTVLRRFARGRPTWLDHVIDVGARRVLAVAQANEADELAVVGHSSGGIIASAIIARALELDPDLGRRGPRLVLLTLGSVMPVVALHSAQQRMRNIVRRLAIEPTLAWIDCQSRKDVICFANFDPVDGIGIHVGAQRCNPLLWRISFKEMIAPENYGRFRRKFFRMHHQYIVAGDRPAPYDYILLVGGPMAIAEWPKRARELMVTFMQNGTSGSERCHHDVPSCG